MSILLGVTHVVCQCPVRYGARKMKQEFTDEERAAFSNDADLRYWPKETQHPAVRKMIPLLGHLARGSQEVAQLDGPVGTEMVTLPGVLQPGEWEITRCELTGIL